MTSVPAHAPSPLQAATSAGVRSPWLWGLLAAQALLALWAAWHRSLVLDEFHTLHHARAADLGTLLAGLRGDNHPPASFLAVHAARALLGESALALRLPQILFGLATTWLVARTAARVGACAPLAAGLWALSSTQLEFSTQVRMYALSALCAAGAVDALLHRLEAGSAGGARAAGLALVAWTWVGLHTHYYWVLYAAAGAAALALVAVLRRDARSALLGLVPHGLAILLLCLPWYLWGFRVQLASGLPPGMSRTGPSVVPEAYVHLLMWNVRLGGPLLRVVFIASGALALVLAASGCLRLASRGRHAAAWLLGALALGVPAAAATLASLYPRMGFNWSYVLPSAPALVALVGAAAAAGPAARWVVRALLVPTLLLTVLNATSRGTEDYRGAVRWVLASWSEGDAVVCVEAQSSVFSRGLAWDYYAPRVALEGRAVPVREPMGEGFDVADPEALARHARVLLVRRALAESAPLVQRLRAQYPHETMHPFGFGLWVHVFERSPDGAGG